VDIKSEDVPYKQRSVDDPTKGYLSVSPFLPSSSSQQEFKIYYCIPETSHKLYAGTSNPYRQPQHYFK